MRLPLKYIFSSPVSSGLKPVPNSNREDTLPLTLTSPDDGNETPVNIFNKVDLPAPLFPMIPTISPLFTWKETSVKALNSLTSFFAKGFIMFLILLDFES